MGEGLRFKPKWHCCEYNLLAARVTSEEVSDVMMGTDQKGAVGVYEFMLHWFPFCVCRESGEKPLNNPLHFHLYPIVNGISSR